MLDWNQVGRQHVHAAMAECDRIGSREFLARYRFGRAHDATLWHGGEEYDARALLGLAYLRATGATVPSDEFAVGGEDAAVRWLRGLGFDVVVDDTLTPPPPKPRAAPSAPVSRPATKAASKPSTPRKAAAPKRTVVRSARSSAAMPEPDICPRCFMALPATGVCDNCD
ncbi:MAG: hypothetical protein HOQ22_09075 [Nocardioidaceae bacterium]|nr:hypothetical protein [Nocardioidaceae bacterium]NUS51172.1 hypothetical protein [Nocardioidaceae bacterium]